METAQHHQQFSALAEAAAYAEAHQLRQKAVCYVVRGAELLVFDHVPDGGAGVQVVAGGLEAGETPEQAALREAGEETGRTGFGSPQYLGSAVWLNSEHAKRELRHFVRVTAPADLPATWQHHADGHLFSFRWADLHAPGLDWEMGAGLPFLPQHQQSNPSASQLYKSVSFADSSP